MGDYQISRVRQCIEDRLREPGLSIESIAAQLNMSPGHLHRLFRDQLQSPAQYLWTRRLDACSRELLDARRAKATVSEIAFGWGFNDAAHFSRSFKARFGCSPREWRRQSGGID
ncbi:helix-turn-helix domain-containing protein [Marinobacter nauticus]|nr:helix-turn-helix domain-containing protein [Marinobacter nauticus]